MTNLGKAFIESFREMHRTGNYWMEFFLPRQCGATHGLLEAAKGIVPIKKTSVYFWSIEAAKDALKNNGLNKTFIPNSLMHLTEDVFRSEEEHYIFIDNLQYGSLTPLEILRVKDEVKEKQGLVKVLVVNTGVKNV